MVLHSRGCGRVARRRFTRWASRSSLWLPGGPFFYALFSGFPAGVAPGTLFLFVVPARRPEHVAPGVGRLFLFPVGSVCFGLPKGIFVVPQRLLVNRYFFRNALLTRYMIRFSEYGLWNGIGKDGNDVPEHRSAACTM